MSRRRRFREPSAGFDHLQSSAVFGALGVFVGLVLGENRVALAGLTLLAIAGAVLGWRLRRERRFRRRR